MSSLFFGNSRNTVLLALGLAASVSAPILISAPAMAANFVDVQSHWARPFIETLAEQNIISGYSDSTFRPDQPITRAQLTAMLRQAFDENNVQLSRKFDSFAADDWASRDLSNGRSSNSQSRPSDQLSKVQVLVALSKGLGLN
ncbi:MAG: S-layer homology domain-containing protein, partial [Coleofasciculus sp. Co-bin14]|nr:S-layer homology domain-containing protein [Coleofasciculus sp. Co-bin14]